MKGGGNTIGLGRDDAGESNERMDGSLSAGS